MICDNLKPCEDTKKQKSLEYEQGFLSSFVKYKFANLS